MNDFVHPDLRPSLVDYQTLDISLDMLELFRQGMKARYVAYDGVEDGIAVEEIMIPGLEPDLQLRALCYSPMNMAADAPAVLHVHGGGYVLGDPEMTTHRNRRLACAIGGTVVSIDYRLAPENPYPLPLDDCLAAWQWMCAKSTARGINPARMGLIGESAGGGLAAGLALRLRDVAEATVQPAAVVLIFPMLDNRVGPDSPQGRLPRHVWTAKSNAVGWNAYLGQKSGSEPPAPWAVPARATNFDNLPQTYIGVGNTDLFFEENLAFAQALQEANTPVVLDIVPGGFHGFPLQAPDAPVSIAFERDYTRWLASRL